MLEPKCSICKKIKEEILRDGSSKLERRLYACRKFNPRGPETQSDIAREYGFNMISMSKHLKVHQNPDAAKLANEKFNQGLEKQAKKFEVVQDTILDAGIEAIQNGEVKVPASVTASVARDQMNREEKNKDRGLEIQKMLFAYMSGEINGGELTTEAPRDYIEGSL